MKNLKLSTKLKRILIVLLLLIFAFLAYVEIANRNSINMTYRQKFLKTVYPAWMLFTRFAGINAKNFSGNKAPAISFYSLNSTLNNGDTLHFENLKGKKILLVNTASDCGYTSQYDELQKLSGKFKDKLVIIGFPANDFKEQEKGSDAAIAEFCKINYGVTFPLMQKSTVIKSPQQNAVFKWLTDAAQNGWNNKMPSWNFAKYLVNEKGELSNYFDPSVSPLSPAVIKAIE